MLNLSICSFCLNDGSNVTQFLLDWYDALVTQPFIKRTITKPTKFPDAVYVNHETNLSFFTDCRSNTPVCYLHGHSCCTVWKMLVTCYPIYQHPSCQDNADSLYELSLTHYFTGVGGWFMFAMFSLVVLQIFTMKYTSGFVGLCFFIGIVAVGWDIWLVYPNKNRVPWQLDSPTIAPVPVGCSGKIWVNQPKTKHKKIWSVCQILVNNSI